IPTSGPEDVSGLEALLAKKRITASDIVAILGKTEGNGCVNDFTRGYSTFAFKTMLAEAMGISRSEIAKQIAFIMSGGTEGVLSPHITVFARNAASAGAPAAGDKRLSIGVAHSRVFRPEDIGRMAQVEGVAATVDAAVKDAGITSADDVHFVQIKCPLL